ncbi:DcaP family trimeric outer membrane transporter [Thalassotalea ponticola]|uniref:DcaP family trimeric outer membrane transporter n=1 Tax=Thalassotalea ponticola TaxID=1523392 RepID=UPI0025B5041A|nr:DcaP family trimeric outer membrane transporter [Thalassotalea ponticola]MDN3651826.1 DcaP family trimeric outer membrane transporter [Thalassotalea ponticola]
MATTTDRTLRPTHVKSILTISAVSLSLASNLTRAEDNDINTRMTELEQRLQVLEQVLTDKDEQIESLKDQIQAEQINQQQAIDDDKTFRAVRAFKQRSSHKYQTPDRSIRLSGTNTRLQIGGQIWLDAIYNSGEMTNRAGFQPSSIAFENDTVDDNTLLTAGQSKLYVKSITPTAYGDMKTRFEFDMFQQDGNASFNLLHLWGELGNFGAGQTFTGFMDIDAFPNTLEYWGPNSMVFARQPLLRYTYLLSENERLAFSIERSDSDFALPNLLAPSSYQYDEVNELPDITAYYYQSGAFGHFKSSFIIRKLGYEAQFIDGGSARDSTYAWGVNLSGAYAVSSADTVKYQLVYGKGISRYLNDPCCNYYADQTGGADAGVNQQGDLRAIKAIGGFVYLDHQWQQSISSSVGLSYIELDNLASQFDNAFAKSLYTTLNVIWSPIAMSKIGIELQYGEVENKVGQSADNTRIQTSFAFKY